MSCWSLQTNKAEAVTSQNCHLVSPNKLRFLELNKRQHVLQKQKRNKEEEEVNQRFLQFFLLVLRIKELDQSCTILGQTFATLSLSPTFQIINNFFFFYENQMKAIICYRYARVVNFKSFSAS